MTKENKFTDKRPRRSRYHLLLATVLIAFQALLFVGMGNFVPNIQKGYLVKQGTTYLVIWKESGKFWERTFPRLTSAISFADEELRLMLSRRLTSAANMERVWVDDRAGKFVLNWKAADRPYLHQWSFYRRTEVDYFVQALRFGSYSRSPFGHSLLLVPSTD